MSVASKGKTQSAADAPLADAAAPELAEEQTEAAAAPAPPETMNTSIANALVTRAPLTAAQIQCAIDHYAALEALLRISGPRFANHRRDAASFHNIAADALAEIEAREAGIALPSPRYRRRLEA